MDGGGPFKGVREATGIMRTPLCTAAPGCSAYCLAYCLKPNGRGAAGVPD
ncbi:hypothetical protein AADR41_20785 [Streptomyces sp. CLV115]